MRLKKLIMINRAPFNKLILDFDDENIAVLSGINGTGKTTTISHIVDAFYELAKKAFPNEFADKTNKFYCVSSGLYSIDTSKTSLVYLRFSNDKLSFIAIDILAALYSFSNSICSKNVFELLAFYIFLYLKP